MNNLKVLVADDDPDLLEICAEILELEGYTVDRAHDGSEALRGDGRELLVPHCRHERVGGRNAASEAQRERRIAGAVARLRGEVVRGVTVRSDLRQLKVELESGLILVVSGERDAQGRPRLEVDVVELPQDASAKQQIEVRFD